MKILRALIISLFAVLMGSTGTANAAAFVVTTTANSGAGSLRAAVTTANTNAQADTVTFNIPANSTGCMGLTCTIILTTDELAILNDGAGNSLTIDGTGVNRVTISGGGANRVLFITANAILNLINLTITGGDGTGSTNVFATSFGGGIFNSGGTLNLNGVTVSGNTVAAGGGGIFSAFFSVTKLTNSTVSGNTSSRTGGILIEGGTLSLTNSTITNNSASDSGGTHTGGVRNAGGTVVVKNTIIAGNTHLINPDVTGAFTSQGYNLVGSTTGSTGFSAILNDILNPVGGALLGALNDNGGQTRTHELLTGSPAIDKGAPIDAATGNPIITDQRGFPRPVDFPNSPNATGGDGSDIGAFEVQLSPTAASVSVSGRITATNGNGIQNVRITLTDSDGETQIVLSNALGYYQFTDVLVGETYILSAKSKHYTFSQPLQVLNITDETSEVNFIANSEKRLRVF
jgi:hypothetical protein